MAAISEKNRSKVMSSIRSKNTKIELTLRSLLWARELRFRIHYNLPERPDIVFLKKEDSVRFIKTKK